MLGAVVEEMVVDELRSVVEVNSKDRERELGDDSLDRFEHPDLRLVAHRPIDGPTRRYVSKSKGSSCGNASGVQSDADNVQNDADGVQVALNPLPDDLSRLQSALGRSESGDLPVGRTGRSPPNPASSLMLLPGRAGRWGVPAGGVSVSSRRVSSPRHVWSCRDCR